MGPSRATVIDAILKTLATLLVPLSTNGSVAENQEYHNDDLTGSKTDFQLISWLLLFLSVCLDDGADKKEQSAMRWEFMSGEADMTKARTQTTSNSGRSFSRSFKKRLLQKQTSITSNGLLEKNCIYPNDKAVQVLQLTSQIELALKQQENLIKKHNVKLYQIQCSMDKKSKLFGNKATNQSAKSAADNNGQQGQGAGGGGGATGGSSGTNNIEQEQAFDKGLRSLKTTNTLVVIRGLIGLLLAMDYTCNMDLFLLTCKVIKIKFNNMTFM